MECESATGKLQRDRIAYLEVMIQRAIRIMDAYLNVPESRQFKEDWEADQKIKDHL